ncbi:hypothetical protein [Stenotrophomonas sp. SMYL20]|uniref:hypothetical protein n=1 Tax=Stenotrophomonas sp. SMYL20 TaxID=3076043 RepID=UPI002E75A0B1|nr:hypothetical protein [Stenotrophomonas sp. SMYL20]
MELGVGDCVVWWDAWAAVGTVLAVFTAIFGPAIQRRFFLKTKANAVFAASYIPDVRKGMVYLDAIRKNYPIGTGTPTAAAVEGHLRDSSEWRESFGLMCSKLEALAGREFDGSKWPSVDLDLLLVVVQAIQGARDVVHSGKVMKGRDAENRDWGEMIPAFHGTLLDASRDIAHAEEALDKVHYYPADRRSLSKWLNALLGRTRSSSY